MPCYKEEIVVITCAHAQNVINSGGFRKRVGGRKIKSSQIAWEATSNHKGTTLSIMCIYHGLQHGVYSPT